MLTCRLITCNMVNTMIHNFTASNFYSIDEAMEISFVVDRNAPIKTGHYHKTPSGIYLSTVETIIGSNASGKTTALKVLSFIRWLLASSYGSTHCIHCDTSQHVPYKPFAKNDKSPTHVGVRFEIEGVVYDYSCSLIKGRVEREELKARDHNKQRAIAKSLFIRSWVQNKRRYEIIDTGFGLSESYINSKELSNTTVIATTKRLGHVVR